MATLAGAIKGTPGIQGMSPAYAYSFSQGYRPLGYMAQAPASGLGSNSGGGSMLPAYGTTMNASWGTGGGMDPNALMSEYNSKYAEAKKANEDRYAEGMQGYGDRYNRGMGYINATNNQNEADIRQMGEKSKAANMQKINQLGLGGSSVGMSMNAGVDQQTAAALNRNQNEMLARKGSVDAQLSGDKLGFLERRQDPYPDMGAYASMMGMLGKTAASGGGGSGAGSGGVGGYGSAGGGGVGDMFGGGFGQPMDSMYVANTGGSSVRGGQTIYGTPQEMARAKAMRASGTIATDPMDATSSVPSGTNSRYGAPYLYGQQMMGPQMGAGGWNNKGYSQFII